MSYSVDITSALAFGHDLNTLEHGDGELQRHITSVFELLARRALGQVPDYFELISFRIIDGRRFNARNELVTLSEATIKLEVGGAQRMIVAEGNGPVNALDRALREALLEIYPELGEIELVNFKVRILDSSKGTQAVTRVLLDSSDGAEEWGAIGVSENVIEASWEALVDSLEHGMQTSRREARRAAAARATS